MPKENDSWATQALRFTWIVMLRNLRGHRKVYTEGNRVSSVGDVRTLWLGGGGDTRTNAGFPDNRVITSKYTLWNFLPKNLFEQFRRIANFYFLCMTILALSIESPVSPATSFVPLVFVIFVTTVKQGYEDWLRHRSDNEVNNALVTVVRCGCRQVSKRIEATAIGDRARGQDSEGKVHYPSGNNFPRI
ncbi:ATP8B4 protein [Gryllus bimaculatus]|nr:ATP8B4 protein [Gryllus bimaculatus]